MNFKMGGEGEDRMNLEKRNMEIKNPETKPSSRIRVLFKKFLDTSKRTPHEAHASDSPLARQVPPSGNCQQVWLLRN